MGEVTQGYPGSETVLFTAGEEGMVTLPLHADTPITERNNVTVRHVVDDGSDNVRVEANIDGNFSIIPLEPGEVAMRGDVYIAHHKRERGG